MVMAPPPQGGRARPLPRRMVVLLALALSACATPGEPRGPQTDDALAPADQLELAHRALRAGRHAEASNRYGAIVRAEPDHAEARLGLGEAHLASGASDEALTWFSALADSPALAPALEIRAAARQGQGIALLRLGRLEEAYAVLEEVATSDPTLWRAWNALGQAFDGRGQWAQARDSYQQALWTAPQPARIYNNIGVSLLRQGEYAAAQAQFGEALRRDPELEIARSNLRLALAFQGRYVEALAGVPDKQMPDALNNIGYIALVRGDYARAEAYFLRALEQSPSFYEPAWKNLHYLAALKE